VRSRPSFDVKRGGSSAQKKRAQDEVDAVAAFVAILPKDAAGRVAGSELYAAYDRCRSEHGWLHLAPNTFGRLLKSAIEAAGGRKLKSSGQIYTGVCIPPEWP
jgi:hypothetical protein